MQKENKNGTMSPDSPEPEDSYSLTPRTEAKYNKIDEDFQMIMQRNPQLTSGRVKFFDVNIITGKLFFFLTLSKLLKNHTDKHV